MTRLVFPSELMYEATTVACTSVDKANAHFGTLYRYPDVRFDLRGHNAGQADVLDWYIRINLDLLIRYPDEQINDTVPHEIAHLIAFKQYGKNILSHGPEWSFIMRELFHLEPTRTHHMQTVAARRVKRYKAYCRCGSHPITSIRLNRMHQGTRYRCRTCKQLLSLTPLAPAPAPTPADWNTLLAGIK